MGDTVTGDLLRGQACLASGITACIALRPQGLTADAGVSYYGVHVETVPPYAFALLGCGWLTRRALRRLVAPGELRRFADLFLALLVGIVLTPYALGPFFDITHTLFGAALFSLQLVLSWRWIGWTGAGLVGVLLLLVEVLGGIIAAVYVLPSHGYLIQGQLIFQFGFGALLLTSVGVLLPDPHPSER